MSIKQGKYNPKDCEIEGCDNQRGAWDTCKDSYGIIMCVSCENKYQLGEL